MNDVIVNGFFAVPVMQRKLENMDDFNKNILDNLDNFIKENPNKKPINWCCDLYMSGLSNNILKNDLFKKLEDPILETSLFFCNKMRYDTINYKLKIADCWLNVYKQGNTQEIHNHPNVDLTGIYYPTSSELDGNLVLKSPFADTMHETPLSSLNSLSPDYVYIPTETSNLILFPSYLMHSVMPNKSDTRVSISFNVKLEKKL